MEDSIAWRFVLYMPNPVFGEAWRVPIGILLKNGSNVEFFRTPCLPCTSCVGGNNSWHLISLMIEDIEENTRFEHLNVGPHILLGQTIPFSDTLKKARKLVNTILSQMTECNKGS